MPCIRLMLRQRVGPEQLSEFRFIASVVKPTHATTDRFAASDDVIGAGCA